MLTLFSVHRDLLWYCLRAPDGACLSEGSLQRCSSRVPYVDEALAREN